MKAIIRISLLFAAVAIVAVNGALAQRVLKGIVYKDGKPAAGITVEVHKGGEMMTSFDGKYEVNADAKSKWIKFTSMALGESKREDISTLQGDVFDYAFTGSLPGGAEAASAEEPGVNLKTMEELVKEQDQEFQMIYSLYDEFYKQDDFKSAMQHWRKVHKQYPKATLNLYIQGAKMLESLIESAPTDTEKDELLNELIKLYDKRAKYFGRDGYVAGRKGVSWLRYKIDNTKRIDPLEGDALKDAIKTGYEWVYKSMEEQGVETELPIFVLVMQTTKSLFKLGEISKETVVTNFDKCNTLLNEIIAKDEDEAKVKDAKETILPFVENVFGTSGAADCESLTNIYAPQFREKGDDIEFIKAMLERLGKARCSDSQLFSDATEKLYELEPSAEAAFNMARRYINKDATKAKEYYKQAMEQETDQDLLAVYYYEFAYFIYAKDNAYSEARNYARKALAINPDYCEANMLIGDIYVAASRSFDGSSLEKSAIFWVANDYFRKAQRGEDCSIDAAQKISNFKKYFPNKEDAFMEGLQAGQSYKVGGWINESTTVRF